MDLIVAVSGVVVLILAYALWIWWNDGKTWEPFYGRACHRIRAALGVVSRDEMSVMQQHFLCKEQEWESRLTKLEGTAKFPNQLQYVSKEIERRLTQLEQSEGLNKSSEPSGPILRPRSLIRLGVRVTLSDVLWAHLGAERVNEIEDHLIDTMVQGPFCPVCLKRVVGRDRQKKISEVPGRCRYCGVSWDCQETVDYPLSVIDFKRQVYFQLDQEYRAGGRMY
jgi:hypothetical protein